MNELAQWIGCGGKILGIVAMAFGLFSAKAPQRSIVLYQWIMERFNWRVTPIDERREIRNTKIMGVSLVVLGAAILFII